jgi:hypothetical protein
MVNPDQDREGLAWQTGVWNRISDIYLREIDQRFAPRRRAPPERRPYTRPRSWIS